MTKTYLAAAAAAMMAMAPVGATLMPVAAYAAMEQYSVYFALGSAKLDSQAMSVVDNAANAIKSGDPTTIKLVGHTDTTAGAAINQPLSERRAQAVKDALVARGVSADRISTEGVGANDLLVATADGVAEQRNRAVVIHYDSASAATPAPSESVVAAVAPSENMWDRFQVDIGPYYGYSQSQDDNLVGGNLSAAYWVTENISIGGEQAIFYPLDHHGYGGRSVGSIDYRLNDLGGMNDLGMTVGVNYGFIYGSGVNDDWIYGPEIGFDLGGWKAKAAYDISDGGLDDSTVSVTLGYVLSF